MMTIDKRNLLDEEDGESIVSSDSTYFYTSGSQVVEEAKLSWRNDPLYK